MWKNLYSAVVNCLLNYSIALNDTDINNRLPLRPVQPFPSGELCGGACMIAPALTVMISAAWDENLYQDNSRISSG
ncbi:hypothetical protein FS595_02555 [Serratia rubidaea]|uniref:hypothetical protein n=1 Tax=Serratia rubidaea TaxID=61652 RepID=UPI001F3F111D|nr:hypothetical protein [Serratia rubidaea]UJD78648.1 hypothetical protein FS596_02555 [Serratia rubidaea]UJD83199.1 hypothetical protein FS595_02555 [Serratia rubidaea]